MTRPIDTSAFHLAIAVRDLEKSRAFYQRLFAMTPTLETDEVVLLTTPARREQGRSSESQTLRSTQTRGTIMVFISASSSARKCSVTPGMQFDRRAARSWLRARARWDLTCSSGTRMATSLNCLSIAVGEPDLSPFQTPGCMKQVHPHQKRHWDSDRLTSACSRRPSAAADAAR
jgi:hypothetical protein